MKRLIVVLNICVVLVACSHAGKEKKQETMVVEPHSLTTTLYYSGVLQPLTTHVITSPTDGVVDNMTFHYGDSVTSNQVLFSIVSEQFQTNYKTALTQYIKAKTDFQMSDAQLKETQFLYAHELISRDEFNAKKTTYYTAQLTFVQAKDTLGNLLQRLDVKGINPYNLKISEIDKITQALHSQNGSRYLQVVSPKEGIILLSAKEGGDDGVLKKISKGTQVKQGDVLAVISDTANLVVHIKVSEFNINQLKIGQKVTVTGAAFSDWVLSGEIIGLDHQGQPDQSGLPVFPVEIAIKNVTAKQQAVIHVGMSAKVAIALGGQPVITVPIRAVWQDDGKSYVQVQDKKTSVVHRVAVKTGATTPDSVVIESNLMAGDCIVLPT